MITINAHEPIPQVENDKHQHAFILVGEKQLFGVHMTQYHCELHKYQVILRLELPEAVHEEFLRRRELLPGETFVLCNAKDPEPGIAHDDVREFCIPDLGSGGVTEFSANLFQGIRPLDPEVVARDQHFFPWDAKYCNPIVPEFTARVERVVLYRPFDHLHEPPAFATYLLFGDGRSGESHMTNLQTARLLSDAFEPPVFGPDYDHVLSLAERPPWLEQDALLEAGVVVTTPIVRLFDPDTGAPSIPGTNPFAEGSRIEVLYRGLGPVYSVTAGATFSYCTAVCNSPRFFAPRPDYDSYLAGLPGVPETLELSVMPRRYWAVPADD